MSDAPATEVSARILRACDETSSAAPSRNGFLLRILSPERRMKRHRITGGRNRPETGALLCCTAVVRLSGELDEYAEEVAK